MNVIEPPAGPPAVVGLITGVPGLFAVPVSVALSLIVPPSWIGPLACVVSVGVTGLTAKHSGFGLPLPASLAFGTPVVPEVNSARQQYVPTEVTVAVSDRMG